MDKSTQNLAVILVVITFAFAGFYFYSQSNSSNLSFESNDQTKQNMLNKTRAYINYTSTLQRIDLDYSFFEDERLLSLQSFSSPPGDLPSGRSNPFADVPGRESVSNF